MQPGGDKKQTQHPQLLMRHCLARLLLLLMRPQADTLTQLLPTQLRLREVHFYSFLLAVKKRGTECNNISSSTKSGVSNIGCADGPVSAPPPSVQQQLTPKVSHASMRPVDCLSSAL